MMYGGVGGVATGILGGGVRGAGRAGGGGGGGGGGSNEPAGMTTIVDNDGSVYEGAGGEAFGWSGASNWGVAVDGERVVDATNPTGSGYALRFRWYEPGSIGCTGNWTEVDTLYMRHRWYFESTGTNPWAFNHKMFYLDGNGGSPSILYMDTVANDGDIRLTGNGGMTVDNPAGNPVAIDTGAVEFDRCLQVSQPLPTIVFDQWVLLEMLFDRPNNRIQLWVDGTLVGDRSDVTYDNDFGHIEWYFNTDNTITDSYFRIGEFYMSGKNQT